MRRPIEERVLELERRMYSIQHDVIGGRQAVPKFDSRPQIRIARVANEPEENDNTFEIVFLDGQFPQTAGQHSATYFDRQLVAKAVAFNLTGNTLTQGTKVPVYYSNGYWWLYAPEGSEPPPPASSVAQRWFGQPKYYHYLTNVEYTNAMKILIDAGNRTKYYVGFSSEVGASMPSVTHSNTIPRFRISESGLYLFDVQMHARPLRISTAAPPPSPAQQFVADIILEGTSDNWYTNPRWLLSMPMTTFTDGDGFSGDGGEVGTVDVYTDARHACSGRLLMNITIPTGLVRDYKLAVQRFTGTGGPASDYGFAVEMLDLAITKVQ